MSFVCADGSACVLDLSFCGECRPLAGLGEACGGDTGVTCGDEAFCRDGQCVAKRKNGEACTDMDRCPLSSICLDGVCTPPQFVGEGEDCDQTHRCQYTTACASNGKCVKLAALGQSCESDAWCDSGYCEAGTCVALKSAGDSCDRPEQCPSAVCEGTCQPLPGGCF